VRTRVTAPAPQQGTCRGPRWARGSPAPWPPPRRPGSHRPRVAGCAEVVGPLLP